MRSARPFERASAAPGLVEPDRPESVLGIPCSVPVASPPAPHRETGAEALSKIEHFIVIYMENHSFDNLYGTFPGAEGLLNSDCAPTMPVQRDGYGAPYTVLPGPRALAGIDASFDELPNRPFAIAPIVPPSVSTIDLIHRFYTQQAQIDEGAMDKFAAYSDAGSFTLGFYDTMSLPVPRIARDFTVCDRFFQSAFGGSFLNHIWLIAAQSPKFPNAPGSVEGGSVIPHGPDPFPVDEDGVFNGQDADFTPDYYVVNTSYSVNTPHPGNVSSDALIPSQTFPTIGDRLSAAGVSWAWYSGGWNDALASAPTDELFQCHHQPFVYFATFADGTAAKAEHLKDERDFLAALNAGTLPAVSFVKPVGINDEHPGFAPLLNGETHLAELIEAIMAAPNWPDTAIIVTYDENGGFADHVAPPVIDRFGPGTRVPTIVISPYAKRRFVDHTEYETVSILATLERRYGLAPLTARDARARDLTPTLTLDHVSEAR